MSLITYPLNNITYSAEDAELFHATRTSGIFAENSFEISVSGADNSVTIGPGIGWIKNGDFSGKVVALKESVTVDLGLPDSVYPRIDAVVLQFDSVKNGTNIVVKKGIASSSPTAPEVVQNENIFELHLLHMRRNVGALIVSFADITDLRLNPVYCGLMADSVTSVDTDAINSQITELISELRSEIAGVIDGSAYWLKEDIIPITNGGTGATNPIEARANLNAAPYGLSEGYYYGFTNAEELDAILDDQIASMEVGTRRVIRLSGKETNPIGGGVYMATIDATYPDYAVVDLVGHPESGRYFKRAKLNGEWRAWEWVNPSLYAGIEYRTIKRFLGKPVYAKVFEFGALPNTSNKSITHGLTPTAIVGLRGVSTNGKYYFPSASSSETVELYINATNIQITTTGDWSNVSAYVIVEYTKD